MVYENRWYFLFNRQEAHLGENEMNRNVSQISRQKTTVRQPSPEGAVHHNVDDLSRNLPNVDATLYDGKR